MQQETAKLARSRMNGPTSSQVHGVLVRVFDTGILIVGESGIGKSECALDLVAKGHGLVADDVVEITAEGGGLSGGAPELTRDLLEIRGLGIINVRELFGAEAVRMTTSVDLCIEFQKSGDVERIENTISEYVVGEISLPRFIIPVRPGRNLSTLVETAARLFLNPESRVKTTERLIEKQAAMLRSRE